MLISIIVAASENGAIGKDNQLLWRLPEDLKRFKRLTLGHPMIMGRKTFESIGKPLPGRTSIVITRQTDFHHEGVIVAHSLEDAIKKAFEEENEETFIIGGGEIYRQAIALADKIYLTKVHTNIEGDTYFEIPDQNEWSEVDLTHHAADDKHHFSFDFIDLEKKNPS